VQATNRKSGESQWRFYQQLCFAGCVTQANQRVIRCGKASLSVFELQEHFEKEVEKTQDLVRGAEGGGSPKLRCFPQGIQAGFV